MAVKADSAKNITHHKKQKVPHIILSVAWACLRYLFLVSMMLLERCGLKTEMLDDWMWWQKAGLGPHGVSTRAGHGPRRLQVRAPTAGNLGPLAWASLGPGHGPGGQGLECESLPVGPLARMDLGPLLGWLGRLG